MLYVERSQDGKICALHAEPQPNATEPISLADTEAIDFLKASGGTQDLLNTLAATDFSVIRVIEDLIDVLTEKNIILLTDLPEAAQRKIHARRRIRQRISSDNLMVDDIL